MGTTDRVLDIFELFAQRGRPLTLSQVAAELDAPISSIFSLVKSLSERGYLRSVGNRKELYPTRRMLQNATFIAQHEPVIAQLDDLLDALRSETGETVILGQMNARSTGVIYLTVLEGPQNIRYSSVVGDTKPVHASAIGKSLLGMMPDTKLEALIAKLKRPRYTSATLTDPALLKLNIQAGRRKGYYQTVGEHIVDVGAVAMPVEAFDQSFGIAVAGPINRISADEDGIVHALRACVERIAALVEAELNQAVAPRVPREALRLSG